MKKLAETTQYTVEHCIDDYLATRWGTSNALDIQPLEIEKWLGALPLANPTKDKLRRIMSIIYTQAQKYGVVPRSESSNPVRWVEQSAKSRYKPVVVDPETAARILEGLSGAELALTILVAATGVRISEALGLKWEDIDYENRQIHLRRVWVNDTVVDHLKTEDSEAPVPLTDLLANCLRAWQTETNVRTAERLGFRQQEEQGPDTPLKRRSGGGPPQACGYRCRSKATRRATVRLFTTCSTDWRVGW